MVSTLQGVGAAQARAGNLTPTGPLLPRVYFAKTTHRRNSNAPGGVSRTFRYSTCYWLVDVDNLPILPKPLRPFTRFEARDHLGDPDAGIADNVRAVLAANDLRADRIMLLTCPRVAGHVFNPLSTFYCFAARADQLESDVTDGERVDDLNRAGGGGTSQPPRGWGIDPRGDGGLDLVAVIAEVHNTYGGRHVYVLRPDAAGRDTVGKEFYVSPFLPMGGTYLMRTPVPGEDLAVSIALRQDGQTPFVATLSGRGRPVTTRSAIAALARWPLLTVRTAALIRWQGIRLWLRRVPVQPRPADARDR